MQKVKVKGEDEWVRGLVLKREKEVECGVELVVVGGVICVNHANHFGE